MAQRHRRLKLQGCHEYTAKPPPTAHARHTKLKLLQYKSIYRGIVSEHIECSRYGFIVLPTLNPAI
jgi:hypothetical protein